MARHLLHQEIRTFIKSCPTQLQHPRFVQTRQNPQARSSFIQQVLRSRSCVQEIHKKFLLSQLKGGGSAHVRNLSLTKEWTQHVDDASGHQGRADIEQEVDQRWTYRVRRVGIR